MVEHYLY